MKNLEVIGMIGDAGFMGFDFFDIYCHMCDNEVYNIPICCASLCPYCESILMPCSVCIDESECILADQLYLLQKQTDLRTTEQQKIHCGKRHFDALDNSVELRTAVNREDFKVKN